ncbi:ribonuclease HI [Fervidobacterium thailandense]|uniref:RNase H type-1 domain-containing protein n=1 Tax=Fervidobacterium thailandense TaxID=1008305 RepID=A0A1E3G3H9_9BACT|nr:RNase H family protein [Fervidobacterium thailandense]ODN30759.1 hypothetical protein A4H02_04330 [Fervidobacterium thailandense]
MVGVVRVYTDGSYKNGYVAYGFAIYGRGYFGNPYVYVARATTSLQNVEAELRAVIAALKFLKANFGKLRNVPVLICHDLDAVRDIPRNVKAQNRNPFFKRYAEEINGLCQAMECKLVFEKVRGHYHELHNKIDRAVRKKLNEACAMIG